MRIQSEPWLKTTLKSAEIPCTAAHSSPHQDIDINLDMENVK